jgi:hypothetical protein
MQYMGRLIWLKESATKEDYLETANFGKVDSSAGVPARYLNPDSFQAYLTLLSLSTRISEFFHRLSEKGVQSTDIAQPIARSALANGWVSASNYDGENVPTVTSEKIEFQKIHAFVLDSAGESIPASMFTAVGSNSGTTRNNSGAVFNSYASPSSSFIKSGVISSLTSPGLIFKFNHQLALPDPNLIGDILGRHFLLCLGDTTIEQFENLAFLKSGLSALRLTRLGDELTHFYKCIEIAIGCNSGCVPFFSGSSYEGCVVSGGPGATVLINGDLIPFFPVTTLKDDFLMVSDHSSALNNIATYFTGRSKEATRKVESMVDLREICLSQEVTQDVRDNIIRLASNLDFGLEFWVVNPANLKKCFMLLSDLSTLTLDTYPIGRLALFSKDPAVVALSCFGEKSCPTWEIPNGVKCSLSKPNPPMPPTAPRGRGPTGQTSDAAWIMVVRYTDLLSAVDEFKRMAATLQYRSTPSSIAKKVGHRVFSRDRMGEFWREMREALRHVNPNAPFEVEGEGSKRQRSLGSEGTLSEEKSTKIRRLDF